MARKSPAQLDREIAEALSDSMKPQELVAAAQKAHKGPWRTDLVVATIKKLWGGSATANAKKIWRYFRDDARDVLNARFWADVYLNKLGGTYD